MPRRTVKAEVKTTTTHLRSADGYLECRGQLPDALNGASRSLERAWMMGKRDVRLQGGRYVVRDVELKASKVRSRVTCSKCLQLLRLRDDGVELDEREARGERLTRAEIRRLDRFYELDAGGCTEEDRADNEAEYIAKTPVRKPGRVTEASYRPTAADLAAAAEAFAVKPSTDPEICEAFRVLGLQATVCDGALGDGLVQWFLGLGILTGRNKKLRVKVGLDGASAERLYDTITARKSAQLATVKQLRFLARKGVVTPESGRTMTFTAASRTIEEIISIENRCLGDATGDELLDQEDLH